jgi:hypothetical protein
MEFFDMRPIGFSTGALALGDFRAALRLLEAHPVKAVELSALRDTELATLMSALPSLALSSYEYVSVHAPSRFTTMSEQRVADLLTVCIEQKTHVVLHPDVIKDRGCWTQFGNLLCIENMDNRKRAGRTADELDPFFNEFVDAGFCFDIAHVRQVDGTMTEAHEMLRRFGSRIVQVHLSEIDATGHHYGLSVASVRAARRIAERISPNVPVIIESQVEASELDREIAMAIMAFEKPQIAWADSEFATVD